MPFDTSLFTASQVAASISPPGVRDTTLGLTTTIIQTTDAWAIDISWALSGSLLFPTVSLVGGWNVVAFLEPLDDGANVPMLLSIPGVTTSAPVPIPMAGGTSNVTISVPAGAVRAGLFNLTIAITWTVGATPLPMAAFSQGPILSFFVP